MIMTCNSKLKFVFLLLVLIVGCNGKDTISAQIKTNASIPENSEIYGIVERGEKLSEEIIHVEIVEEEKVGITLKYDPSTYNRIVYVDRNITELGFSKIAIIGIEGLGQLKFLETIVFDMVSDLDSFNFLTEIPHLKRLFINYNMKNIDWGFIEQLPDLEVLSVASFFRQSVININLRNNSHIEYLGFTSGILETFPSLFNIANTLKYLNLEGNKIKTLPDDFIKYNNAIVILSINPFEKDRAPPNNVTLEFSYKIIGQKYQLPTDILYITGKRD